MPPRWRWNRLFRSGRVVKACLHGALLWQIWSLVFYGGRVARTLSQPRQQQQLPPPHDGPVVPENNNDDAGDAPRMELYTPTIGLEYALRPRSSGSPRRPSGGNSITTAMTTTTSKAGKDTAPTRNSDAKPDDSSNHTSEKAAGTKPSSSSAAAAAALTTTATTNATKPVDGSVSSSSERNIRTECFPFNSEAWIRGEIFSNNDEGVTPGLLEALMEAPQNLERLPSVFDQTLCHDDSPLRASFGPDDDDLPEEEDGGGGEAATGTVESLSATEDWYQRFLYLALHRSFHRPALAEHRARRACAMNEDTAGEYESFRRNHGIGDLDYECPGARYVVIPVASVGLGAFLNTQASLGLLVALRTHRIPVFSTRSFFPWQFQKGETTDPWLLAPARCSRRDLQCYFLPPSPCTVTTEDLDGAPVFGSDGREQRYLGKTGRLPPELDAARVVVINPGLRYRPEAADPELPGIVSDEIRALLEEDHQRAVGGGGAVLPRRRRLLLERAHRWLTEKADADPSGLVRHAAIYLLRPNPRYKTLLDDKMTTLFSSLRQGENTAAAATIDPSDTVGIAIRGSDKCLGESTCHPFETYMDLVTEIGLPELVAARTPNSSAVGDGRHHHRRSRPNLILTTEDPGVFNDSLPYRNDETFPFRFLVNPDDNMQGSGFPKDFSSSSPRLRKNGRKAVLDPPEDDDDDDDDESEKTMVSSLVALRFHFHASRVYLNCCSNFHMVLQKLLEGQCGARRHGNGFVFFGNATKAATGTATEPSTATATSTIPPPVGVCLNSPDTPRRYRLCCNWSRDSGCKSIWADYRGNDNNNNNNTTITTA